MKRFQFSHSSTIPRLSGIEKTIVNRAHIYAHKTNSSLNEARKRMERQKPNLSLAELPGILEAKKIFTTDEFNRWMRVRCRDGWDEPVADLVCKLILHYYKQATTT